MSPRFLSSLVVLILCAAGSAQSAPTAKVDDTVVGLSAFEVTAERIDFNKWIEVTSPHFIIYTDATTKETRLLAKQLEMTQMAVQFYFHREMRKEPPLIVILPTSESDWRKVKATNTQWKPASVLLQESRALVLVDDDWQENPGYLLAMVGKHTCDLMNIDGPTWFSSGLTSFFQTISFRGDTLAIGKAGPWSVAVTQHGFMKWDRFFEVTPDSPEFYADTVEHQRFFGQSTAFIHYLLTGSDKTAVTKLLRWAAISEGKDKPSEQDFHEVFGESYGAIQNDISKLLTGGKYTSGKISFPPQTLKFDIESRPAPPREMRELFVLAQAMVQHGDDSLAAVAAILKNGLKNENLRELLADSCLVRGRAQDALKQYKILIDSGSANAAVFEKAALIEVHEAKVLENLDHHLGTERDQIEQSAKRAVELDPLYFDAYDILAWVHAMGTDVKPEDIAAISQICHSLNGKGPTDKALAALAVACWRTGDTKKAQQIDSMLIESPYTRRSVRKTAEALKTRLIAPTPTVGV